MSTLKSVHALRCSHKQPCPREDTHLTSSCDTGLQPVAFCGKSYIGLLLLFDALLLAKYRKAWGNLLLAHDIFIPFQLCPREKEDLHPGTSRMQSYEWQPCVALRSLFFFTEWVRCWQMPSISHHLPVAPSPVMIKAHLRSTSGEKKEIANRTPRARQEKQVNKWLTHFVDRLEGPQRKLCWGQVWAGEVEEAVPDGGGTPEGLGNNSLFLRVPRE